MRGNATTLKKSALREKCQINSRGEAGWFAKLREKLKEFSRAHGEEYETHVHAARRTTRQALWPPKPKLFDRTLSMERGRASFGT